MGINYEIVISMIVLLATGLGLGLGLKFLKSITNGSRILFSMWTFESQKFRFTIWLILGSLFVKPFMDLSSLLIEFSRVPLLLMQPVSERELPPDWDIIHYAWYLVIRAIMFGLVYGYAVWMVPKLMALHSINNGISIKPRSFKGACIVLASGSLLHGLIAPLAFSIQQLPILALLGYKDSIANYFFGWLVIFILLPMMLYGLSRVLRNSFETPILLGSNPSEHPLES